MAPPLTLWSGACDHASWWAVFDATLDVGEAPRGLCPVCGAVVLSADEGRIG